MSAGSGRAVLVSQRIVRDGEEIRDALDVRWTSFLAAGAGGAGPSGANLDDSPRRARRGRAVAHRRQRSHDRLGRSVVQPRRPRAAAVPPVAGRPIAAFAGAQFLAWRLGFAIEPIDGRTATRSRHRRGRLAMTLLRRVEVACSTPSRRVARPGRAVAAGSNDAAGTIEAIEHAIDPLLGSCGTPSARRRSVPSTYIFGGSSTGRSSRGRPANDASAHGRRARPVPFAEERFSRHHGSPGERASAMSSSSQATARRVTAPGSARATMPTSPRPAWSLAVCAEDVLEGDA